MTVKNPGKEKESGSVSAGASIPRPPVDAIPGALRRRGIRNSSPKNYMGYGKWVEDSTNKGHFIWQGYKDRNWTQPIGPKTPDLPKKPGTARQ